MSKVRCEFCRKTRKRGKEHVWPQWLQRFVEGGDALHAETHYSISGKFVSQRTLQNKANVLGHVCEVCNGGWMSGLERDAMPTIRSILLSDSLLGTSIRSDDCIALAKWAFKTAIVRNLATNYRRLVPPHHFASLHDKRSIPDCTFIDLALCPSHLGLSALQSQTALGFVTLGDEELFAKGRAAIYNICIGVGPIVTRVVYLPIPGYEVKTGLTHDRKALRLWPSPTDITLTLENLVTDLYDLETSTFFDERLTAGTA